MEENERKLLEDVDGVYDLFRSLSDEALSELYKSIMLDLHAMSWRLKKGKSYDVRVPVMAEVAMSGPSLGLGVTCYGLTKGLQKHGAPRLQNSSGGT